MCHHVQVSLHGFSGSNIGPLTYKADTLPKVLSTGPPNNYSKINFFVTYLWQMSDLCAYFMAMYTLSHRRTSQAQRDHTRGDVYEVPIEQIQLDLNSGQRSEILL